jgi:hypothetical protein
MTARVITDPSALGWVLDPDTGRWEWSGSGDGGGSGGGGGAWELLETVDISGADMVELSEISQDYSAYRVIWSGAYSSSPVNSLQMQYVKTNGTTDPYHSSRAYASSGNTNQPPHGGAEDATGGNYCEIGAYSSGAGFASAMFQGEIDLYMPDLSDAGLAAWNRPVNFSHKSYFTIETAEFRHIGRYNMGTGSNPNRVISGLRFTGKDSPSGATATFAGGTVQLLGLKRD